MSLRITLYKGSIAVTVPKPDVNEFKCHLKVMNPELQIRRIDSFRTEDFVTIEGKPKYLYEFLNKLCHGSIIRIRREE